MNSFLGIITLLLGMVWSVGLAIPQLHVEEEQEIPSFELDLLDEGASKKIPSLEVEEQEIPMFNVDPQEIKKLELERKKRKKESVLKAAPEQKSKKELNTPVKLKPMKKVSFVTTDHAKKEVQKSLTKKKKDTFLDLTPTEHDISQVKEKAANPLTVSKSWKQMMEEEFAQHTEYISDIVKHGEESEQEKIDFMKRFEQNKEWAASTLQSTTTVADPQFDLFMERKERLDLLVKAQQHAEKLIQKMSSVKEISPEVIAKIRLAVLYALNDYLVDKKKMPKRSVIEAIVSEKSMKYGDFKVKDAAAVEPKEVVVLEKEQEASLLKKMLKEQNLAHERDYQELLKQLHTTEAEYQETKSKLATLAQNLDETKQALQETTLAHNLEMQVREEESFSAQKTVDAVRKKTVELETALERAEREKSEAEKSLRKALAEYKDVSDLVALLQQESKGLSEENTTLLRSLEKAEKDRTDLELEKKQMQRQQERLKNEIESLEQKLAEQKKGTDKLSISLENMMHDRSYALSQISTMKKMQKTYAQTEKALSVRLQKLQRQLSDTQEQARELEALAYALKKEQKATVEHIEYLERIRDENVQNRTILKQEISRVMEEQVAHRIKTEKLQNTLKEEGLSKQRAKEVKKKLQEIKKADEEADLDLSALQDMYEIAQVQEDNLTRMVQELKSMVFDQDLELAELEKSLQAHRQTINQQGVTKGEQDVTALKRKNRALKNRIAALEAKLESRPASLADQYFAPKAGNKKQSAGVQRPFVPEKLPRSRPVKKSKDRVPMKPKKESASPLTETKPVEPKKDEFEDLIKQVEQEEQRQKAKLSPVEEIPLKEPQKAVQEQKPAALEEIVGTGQKTVPPAPSVPAASAKKEPAGVAKKLKEGAKQALPGGRMPLPNKEEMQEVVDTIKQTITENPEEFEQFMAQVQPPTEEQIKQAEEEIAKMSPEERAQFEDFMQNFMSSFAQ